MFFEDNNDSKPEERIDINTFAESLRVLLEEPELLNLYPINRNQPTGEFWFMVELLNHGVSRTIAIPIAMTLHDMVQKSVNFDNDHFYNFYLNWRNPLNGECYCSPEDDWSGNPSADTIALAQLNLYESQRLLYIFDLADRWEFWITVVRHLPDATTTNARIVEKIDRAPKQYAN